MKTVVRSIAGLAAAAGIYFAALGALCYAELPDADTAAVLEDTTVAAADGLCVILDAGHGGEDGGAVSVNGMTEKELNLSVVRTMEEMLTLCGVRVILTRSTDDGLYEGASAGHRKMTDLKNRLAVRRAYPDALFVSVHMNTFSDPSCRGMQIYCADNAASHSLAEAMRLSGCTYLQPDNTRACKTAGGTIYLLDRAEGCSVLAECGFLSCPEEADRLADSAYRKKLAAVLCRGILEYARAGGPEESAPDAQ